MLETLVQAGGGNGRGGRAAYEDGGDRSPPLPQNAYVYIAMGAHVGERLKLKCGLRFPVYRWRCLEATAFYKRNPGM